MYPRSSVSFTVRWERSGVHPVIVHFQPDCLPFLPAWKWSCPSFSSFKNCQFGKLSSGHRTGKGQFPFQSLRKAMPMNAPTTAQLHWSHTLAEWCSKFSKPGFNTTWTVNYQMFKLVLEKAEEPEIKLQTSAGSSKSKRVPEKHPFLLYWLCQSLWLCGSQ